MPTAVENSFMADPQAFMADNVLRVICGKQRGGQYNFSLVARDIPTRKRNRRGRAAPYYELTQADTGAIPMWFLPYAENDVRETTLPTNGADLMTTVQLNGCTFGHAQPNNNVGCYVTHHNDKRHHNDPNEIQNQNLPNYPYQPGDFEYFHQTGYRKLRGGQVDNRYFATIIGKRDGTDHWHFYAQKKKQIVVNNSQMWTLKGVVVVNP